MTTRSMPPQQNDEHTPLLLLLPTHPTTTHPTKKPWPGRGWLLLVALLYGTLNVTLRAMYAQPHPPSAAALSASRGWLAVVCFLPLWWWWSRRRRSSSTTSTTTTHATLAFQKQAFELAVWNFGAQGLANIGLRTVPSARAAFLTQTSVVWTPFLSLWLVQAKPQRRQWWASLVCVCGLCVLSWSSSSTSTSSTTETLSSSSSSYQPQHHSRTPGHVLLLLAAGCWSMYIIRLSLFSSNDENEIPLQAYKNVYLASLYSVWWCLQSWTAATRPPLDDDDEDSSVWYHDTRIWWLLLYSAVGPGTLADIWQQQGQSLLQNATESNVWLSLEPVFTALLGFVCLHEQLSWHEMSGGALVVCAALLSATSTGE